MATERAEFRQREKTREHVRLARFTLNRIGWDANASEIHAFAQGEWEQLDHQDTAAVVELAKALQIEARGRVRHIPLDATKEEAMRNEHAEKIREVTREILQATPELNLQDAYERMLSRVPEAGIKPSSYGVGYFYPIRKELQENGSEPAPVKREAARKRGRRPRPEAPDREGIKADPVVLNEKTQPLDAVSKVARNPWAGRADLLDIEKRLLRALELIEKEHQEVETALHVISRYKEQEVGRGD